MPQPSGSEGQRECLGSEFLPDPNFAAVSSDIKPGIAVPIALELDEQKYVGTGAFLFASVLERFLGLYVSMNSFTKLKARTRQGEGYFKTWAPRAGEIQLL